MSRENYKAAGVDVEAGYEAVRLMKDHVARTKIPGVIGGLGGFGGLFELNIKDYKEPVLVSGTDGVGTKLKIAMLMNKCDTVGQDCVAMCVNDIICSGAKPLFFLDYIAVGKNVPQRVADIVKGVADGCVYGGCALVGGETAEMPGFYDPDEYDIAGFAVGVVEKSKIIDGKGMKKGDKVIGIASSGVHSNGFSLVRKVFHLNDERGSALLNQKFDQLGDDVTLGEALLTPTRIYVKQMLSVMDEMEVHGISHITGGGFYENLPRMLPDGLAIRIEKDSFPVLPIFRLLQDAARMSEDEMFHTFNMGIGMAFVVDAENAEAALGMLRDMGEEAYVIGEITEGEKEVTIC